MAKLQLSVEDRVVRLVAIGSADKIIDEEIWTLPKTIADAAGEELIGEVFSDAYDYINLCVHGGE
jgi:hypothetical protein